MRRFGILSLQISWHGTDGSLPPGCRAARKNGRPQANGKTAGTAGKSPETGGAVHQRSARPRQQTPAEGGRAAICTNFHHPPRMEHLHRAPRKTGVVVKAVTGRPRLMIRKLLKVKRLRRLVSRRWSSAFTTGADRW